MSAEGMTGCGEPGYSVKGHVNQRQFAAHRGLKWSHGVNLKADAYYAGCTPLVKETVEVDDGTGTMVPRLQYRHMLATERCFDAVLRCPSDQQAANLSRTLRASVIVHGEMFEDAIQGLPDGVDVSEIESSSPATLSLRKKVASGLGDPTEAELNAWGM